METTVNKGTILEHLERILTHEEFANSEVNRGLLRYLVEASLSGRTPKEVEIAIEYFGRSSTFNANEESVVRSHIYAIRKKLEKYYLTAGANDRIRLVIPKGKYEVRIEKVECRKATRRVELITITAAILLGLNIVVLMLNLILTHRHSSDNGWAIDVDPNHPMWKDMLATKVPIRIVMGDYFAFMVKERKTLGDRRVRDGAINSEADLQAFLDQHPQERANLADQRSWYLSSNVVTTLETLLPFLKRYASEVTLTTASQLTEEQLRNDNIVFIGPLKTLGLLNRYLEEIGLDLELYPHRIIKSKERSRSYARINITVDADLFYERDYGLNIHLHPDERRYIIIMTAFSGLGVEETVRKALSDPIADHINQRFKEMLLEKDSDFYILYEYNMIGGRVFGEIIDLNIILPPGS